MLGSAQDAPLPYQTNSERLEFHLKDRPHVLERAKGPVRGFVEAYFEGDTERMDSFWHDQGFVSKVMFSQTPGSWDYQYNQIMARSWLLLIEMEIKEKGLEVWKEEQRHAKHEPHVTVLRITEQGALVVLENPMRYRMGTEEDRTRLPYGFASVVFKVIFTSQGPKILELSTEPSDGC